jgi:uncharacterized protein (TIGR00297 family)
MLLLNFLLATRYSLAPRSAGYTSPVLGLDTPALLRRLLLAVLVAGGLALAARKARALTRDGAAAAAAVGIACMVAGWAWVALLMIFFVTSTVWSRIGRARKESRTAGIASKGDERDTLQVLANGGAFALAAAASVLWPSTVWYALGAGAVSAATADTWATEIGTLSDAEPRSVWTWRRVVPGTSGGVTPVGTGAAAAGAVLIGTTAIGVGWPRAAAWGAVVGGLAGSMVDSLLGATVQARRWCARCGRSTERTVHSCGEPTQHEGGLRWLDNDGVNALSTAAGALIAWGVARSLA